MASSAGRGFRDLRVWQAGMDLADAVLRISAGLPREYQFSLGEQMRRAAISVPSNIAEGYMRPHAPGSTTEYRRFLGIARGSLAELETQLELAGRRGHIDRVELRRALTLASETARMLSRLYASLTPATPEGGATE